MKLKLLVLALIVMVGGSRPLLAASAGDQGLGVVLGSPTGVTMKFWMSDEVALDATLGVAQGELDVHAAFLFHDFDLFKRAGLVTPGSTFDLPFYIGFGPRVLFKDDTEFGLRLPIGIALFPHQTPWEFFLEFAPVIRLTPSVGVNGDFGIGVRYYFEAIRPRS